jgi:hypothetical protein
MESLEAAFATWVKIRGLSQIIIVDWSSKDPSVIDKVARRDSRVTVARVEDEIISTTREPKIWASIYPMANSSSLPTVT